MAEDTSVYTMAEEFVQLTGSSIFLTGKAGTGKTTFLRRMREQTQKQMAVVAPTGVAAINAGGVTIHSLFQLPFTPYVPTEQGRRNLLDKQKVTSVRRKIFQSLEVLVIDEISMVRADVLDAMDAVLRFYRHRRSEPFGGVQVIFIGDMYQLSPVVVNEEWNLLKDYYKSPYFFHSLVMQQATTYYIELDHIFRQSNRQFIELLNQVRNNTLTPAMFQLLETRYKPDFHPTETEGFITLTTHNQKADRINMEELARIDAPVFTYTAKVKGEFPEKSYPNDFELKLKQGAKVMFIANDAGMDRKYYNGKLGHIAKLTDDEILVICDNETEPILVSPETWCNVRYTVNKETNQIEEEELGSYTQYPLRLAWAITIHKSQGLTFDKVVIDAGSAFASGQVYVALSRCRSLDGIVLTTKIKEASLSVDPFIIGFSEQKLPQSQLEQQVEISKAQYSQLLLTRLFSLENINGLIQSFITYITPFAEDFGPLAADYWSSMQQLMTELFSVATRFVTQLKQLFQDKDEEALSKRIAAASDYYGEQLYELMSLIEASPVVTDSNSEAIDYKDRITNIYEQLALTRTLIVGLRNDFSVNNYFAVKANFVVPQLKISCYAGDNKQRNAVKTSHINLYKALAVLRNRICEEQHAPIYVVASTKTLVDISNQLPSTPEQLAQIKGFGKIKVQRYGDLFLEVVAAYCKEEGINREVQVVADFDESDDDDESEKMTTLAKTLRLCRKGLSIEAIAAERNLKVSTIEKHVEECIAADLLPIEDYVDASLLPELRDAFVSGKNITEIYADYDGAVTYGQLRMVRRMLTATK